MTTDVSINNGDVVLTLVSTDYTYVVEYGQPTSVVTSTTDASGFPVDISYDLTLNAETGFLIESVSMIDSAGFPVSFIVSEDGSTAYHNNFDGLSNYNNGVTIEIVTTVKQPPSGVSGFNHLYLVNKEILNNLSNERFLDSGDVVDLGIYMINVLEIPFKINDELIGLETQIKLGNYLLSTKAIEILNDEVIFDVGNIIVPSKYYNSYDYMNTNVYLHLPFSKIIELDINYSISQTINIKYVVDLYSGDTTININSTKLNGEIILNESVKIGRNIPFVSQNNNGVTGDISINNGVNNKIYNAFIEVIRNKPHEINSVFNTDMLKQTTLINESGFIGVNNVILNTEASLQEKNNIVSLLKSGVFIK